LICSLHFSYFNERGIDSIIALYSDSCSFLRPVMKRHFRFILFNIIVLVALLGIAECSVAYLLNHPTSIPEGWVEDMRSYYMTKDRRIAQYVPELAHYDPKLFYRLNPGNHRFENREFSTALSVNSMGLRDDEGSLNRPEIVFLGDSYTMGWGVEAKDCFASIVEQQTGSRTLNTGISSYGTVRELELLKQIDTSALKLLVVQYSFNDFGENTDFYFSEIGYRPSSEEEYTTTVKEHADATAYFPLKHISHFARSWFETYFPPPQEPQTEEELPYVDQWKAFANVLQKAAIPPHVPIVVIQVDSEHQQDVFIRPLKANVLQNDSLLPNRVHVLDLQQFLTDDHYYLLDRHLNAAGHAEVGRALSEFIASLQKAE
jgi:hypothetical protein